MSRGVPVDLHSHCCNPTVLQLPTRPLAPGENTEWKYLASKMKQYSSSSRSPAPAAVDPYSRKFAGARRAAAPPAAGLPPFKKVKKEGAASDVDGAEQAEGSGDDE